MKMKLYVWTNFSPDYTGGLAFALAKTERTARKLVIEEKGCEPYCWGSLCVHDVTSEMARCASGGG